MKQNVSKSFVADVMLMLISKIKDNKDDYLRCVFWLKDLPKQPYGISRTTQYRRLKELERAGIIELVTWEKGPYGWGKCWLPTEEFHSKVVRLLE